MKMSYAPLTMLVEEHKSPPCKKRRTLDIADVSCLVATGQKAAFLSPKKTIHSKSSDIQPSRNPPDINQGVDVLSQELLEEDTMIQSSLPQYLDHIFGGCIGCSKIHVTDYKEEKPTSFRNSFPVNDGSVDCGSPVIEESQGFTVRGLSEGTVNLTGAESESTAHVTNNASPTNMELSPLLFHSPISPPKSPSNADSACAQTSSNTVSLPRPIQVKNLKTISHIDKPTALPTSLPPAAVSKTSHVSISNSKDKSTTSRKRKLSSSKTPKKKSKYKYMCPPSCVSLMDCTCIKSESIVSILAIILQVNSIMEVACKRGSMAGRTVPVASLLLADPTKSCMKLLLWREAAHWVERIVAGDFIYFSLIRLKYWKEEVVGHTMMRSKVLNLHQPKRGLPSKLLETIPMESIEGLQEWGRSRHGYLFSNTQTIPSSQRPVHFRRYDELGVESVVHFRGKLVDIISDRVVLFSDKPGNDVFLYLLGTTGGMWYRELSRGVGQVWELQHVAVTLEGTQGRHSLQVTSKSQLRRLPVDSIDAVDILKHFSSSSQSNHILAVPSISALLQCRSSGVVKCKAKAVTFNFQLMDHSVLSLHSLSELCGLELVSNLLQAVYVGCEACSKPLTQDLNCVYGPCDNCVMKTPGGHLTSAYCYRPLVIGLCDDSAAMDVVANQVVVSKLLGGVEATELVHSSLAQNLTQCEAVRDVMVRLLGSDDSDCWILNTAFIVDDFSFVESLTVCLLDRIP